MNIDDVISIPMKNHKNREDLEVFKNRLLTNPDILAVGGASAINGVSGSQSNIHVNDSAETEVQTRMGYQGFGFMQVIDVPLVMGRYFDESIATDESRALIINRAMMDYLQWDDPIGKEFQPMYNDSLPRIVVGVIEDYHYYSLHWKIEPAAYYIDYSDVHVAGVRVRPGTLETSISFIEQVWDELFPEANFDYQLATDAARDQYDGLKRTNQVFGWFSILSIVISILGLWGVSSLNIDRRVKEIGVRKVLGGSVNQIMFLLQKDFLKLVLIAGIIAIPIGYFLTQNLLTQFAYRVNIRIWYYLGAILLAFVVASLTIGIKALRAARSNPVEALKYE
jgi:putative ABC transport system permease protein